MYTERSEPFVTKFEASYAWEYDTHEEALRNLYEKSKLAQWNAKTDIDWSLDVDPQDESRHVAFGVLSLRDHYSEMSDAELAVREEFATEACWLMRDRLFPKVVWEEFGLPVHEILEITDKSRTLSQFRTMLFSKIVPNVKRLGLLNDRLRAQFAKLQILGFEDWEPSA